MRMLLLLVMFAAAPIGSAHAVPPPDFLFNVGGQIAQTFSVACLCLSAIAGVGMQRIRMTLSAQGFKGRCVIAGGVFLAVILVSIIVTFCIEVGFQ